MVSFPLMKAFDMAEAAKRFVRLCEERDKAVPALMRQNEIDRASATALYDFRQDCRKASGWEMLQEVGAIVDRDEAEAHPSAAIRVVAHALAACGIGICSTDHLSDADLWGRLALALEDRCPEFDMRIGTEYISFMSDADKEQGLDEEVASMRSKWLPKPDCYLKEIIAATKLQAGAQ